jgi:polyhydroxyalkanoate synthesis regulator phasin
MADKCNCGCNTHAGNDDESRTTREGDRPEAERRIEELERRVQELERSAA